MIAYRDNARRRVPVGARVADSATRSQAGASATAQMHLDISRFFVDLRRALGVHPLQAAAHLNTHAGVIAALEGCELAKLPAWPETSRVVLSYAAWAGVDGRPVLSALGVLLRDAEQRRRSAEHIAAVRPAIAASTARLRQASQLLAEGARRLPREALIHARERPARTLYALSLPLAILFLSLNSGVLGQIAAHAPRQLSSVVITVKDTVAVYFAPVREGLHWIEVDNPRSRRGDKLPPA